MIPNASLIERWSVETDDGYVKIPQSAWPELLWVLRQAEAAEKVVEAAAKIVEAHERRAKTAGSWTLREEEALQRIRMELQRIESSRSFAA